MFTQPLAISVLHRTHREPRAPPNNGCHRRVGSPSARLALVDPVVVTAVGRIQGEGHADKKCKRAPAQLAFAACNLQLQLPLHVDKYIRQLHLLYYCTTVLTLCVPRTGTWLQVTTTKQELRSTRDELDQVQVCRCSCVSCGCVWNGGQRGASSLMFGVSSEALRTCRLSYLVG